MKALTADVTREERRWHLKYTCASLTAGIYSPLDFKLDPAMLAECHNQEMMEQQKRLQYLTSVNANLQYPLRSDPPSQLTLSGVGSPMGHVAREELTQIESAEAMVASRDQWAGEDSSFRLSPHLTGEINPSGILEDEKRVAALLMGEGNAELAATMQRASKIIESSEKEKMPSITLNVGPLNKVVPAARLQNDDIPLKYTKPTWHYLVTEQEADVIEGTCTHIFSLLQCVNHCTGKSISDKNVLSLLAQQFLYDEGDLLIKIIQADAEEELKYPSVITDCNFHDFSWYKHYRRLTQPRGEAYIGLHESSCKGDTPNYRFLAKNLTELICSWAQIKLTRIDGQIRKFVRPAGNSAIAQQIKVIAERTSTQDLWSDLRSIANMTEKDFIDGDSSLSQWTRQCFQNGVSDAEGKTVAEFFGGNSSAEEDDGEKLTRKEVFEQFDGIRTFILACFDSENPPRLCDQVPHISDPDTLRESLEAADAAVKSVSPTYPVFAEMLRASLVESVQRCHAAWAESVLGYITTEDVAKLVDEESTQHNNDPAIAAAPSRNAKFLNAGFEFGPETRKKLAEMCPQCFGAGRESNQRTYKTSMLERQIALALQWMLEEGRQKDVLLYLGLALKTNVTYFEDDQKDQGKWSYIFDSDWPMSFLYQCTEEGILHGLKHGTPRVEREDFIEIDEDDVSQSAVSTKIMQQKLLYKFPPAYLNIDLT